MATEITDDTVMTFGQYEGKKLGQIPADYLLALDKSATAPTWLKKYIARNRQVLREELKGIRKARKKEKK